MNCTSPQKYSGRTLKKCVLQVIVVFTCAAQSPGPKEIRGILAQGEQPGDEDPFRTPASRTPIEFGKSLPLPPPSHDSWKGSRQSTSHTSHLSPPPKSLV